MSSWDDLVALGRRGALSAEQRARLDAELSHSSELRTLERIGRAFDAEGRECVGDAALCGDIAAATLARFDAAPLTHGSSSSRHPPPGGLEAALPGAASRPSIWWFVAPIVAISAGALTWAQTQHRAEGPIVEDEVPRATQVLEARPSTRDSEGSSPRENRSTPDAPPEPSRTKTRPPKHPTRADKEAVEAEATSVPGEAAREPGRSALPTQNEGPSQRQLARVVAARRKPSHQKPPLPSPTTAAEPARPGKPGRKEQAESEVMESPEPAVVTRPQPRVATPNATELLRQAQRTRHLSWTAALPKYQALISKFPRSTEAGLAELALARRAAQEERWVRAIHWYRQYQRRAASPLMAEALWGEAGALGELRREEERQRSLRILARDHANTPYGKAAQQKLTPPSRAP